MSNPITSEQSRALRLARVLLENGESLKQVLQNPVIAPELRGFVRQAILREGEAGIEEPRIITGESSQGEWLQNLDRSEWYYWPALRDYLLSSRDWTIPAVRSLDNATDRILTHLAQPSSVSFDIRGLVLGFVQSGKTANFTALIAKAADVGYRLIVVLSGMDNGLRRQTQIRLNRELVGYAVYRAGAISLPPLGKRWHAFTTEELDGDFYPGFANYAALQGSQPVLLVVKKNGPVLRRLLEWLAAAPGDVHRSLPVLVVDDEADQASVDTRGSYLDAEVDDVPPEYEPPAVINGLIRQLLLTFARRCYVAYTATPFANVLIPHDAIDPTVGNDLYPRDFVVDLPKPSGYLGPEELFGRLEPLTGDHTVGLDVVRDIPDHETVALSTGRLPPSLRQALDDFVLAGAARAERGQGSQPATMLVHSSRLVADHQLVGDVVRRTFQELRDEWRYAREAGLRQRLQDRWESEFRPLIRHLHPSLDSSFRNVARHIGAFAEAVDVRVVNSASGDMLDYEAHPGLKVIVIGGNRLSRGLTLEGLTVSYFVRRSSMYDTLLQMGRWFGYRPRYEDLTRIYMTPDLASGFSDLALVEHQLREDIRVYEAQDITPLELGARILVHPGMLVTSRLKQRFARSVTVSQSYSAEVVQTWKFPFQRPADLASLADCNLEVTRRFLAGLGGPSQTPATGPLWNDCDVTSVLSFLSEYRVDPLAFGISLPLVNAYIRHQLSHGELQNWVVAIMGRRTTDPVLGEVDWGTPRYLTRIRQISRSRLLSDPDSLGVITSPGDETVDLTASQKGAARALAGTHNLGLNVAARQVRPPARGLVLLYPISRNSGSNSEGASSRRQRLYEDPGSQQSRDLVGLAISFPQSGRAATIRGEFVVGTVGWRPL